MLPELVDITSAVAAAVRAGPVRRRNQPDLDGTNLAEASRHQGEASPKLAERSQNLRPEQHFGRERLALGADSGKDGCYMRPLPWEIRSSSRHEPRTARRTGSGLTSPIFSPGDRVSAKRGLVNRGTASFDGGPLDEPMCRGFEPPSSKAQQKQSFGAAKL